MPNIVSTQVEQSVCKDVGGWPGRRSYREGHWSRASAALARTEASESKRPRTHIDSGQDLTSIHTKNQLAAIPCSNRKVNITALSS